MKNIVIGLCHSFTSLQAFASVVNCFATKDRQFHLAVGPTQVADFSFTSYPVARKLAKVLGVKPSLNIARSGNIVIDNRVCVETESEIKCSVEASTTFTIFNTFNHNIVRKGGLSGVLQFIKNSKTLNINVVSEQGKSVNENLKFDSNECKENE